MSEFLEHIYRVGRTLIVKGKAAALEQLRVTVKLGEKKGEDRIQSLVGLYCVFFGFLFQLLGAFLVLGGTLVGFMH